MQGVHVCGTPTVGYGDKRPYGAHKTLESGGSLAAGQVTVTIVCQGVREHLFAFDWPSGSERRYCTTESAIRRARRIAKKL